VTPTRASQVKSAYKTQPEPEPYEASVTKGDYVLRLRKDGVWIFLERTVECTPLGLKPPF